MNMKIIKLEAQNVKKIKAISITPDGNSIVIGGDNGEGKTSVLDSIMYAIAGQKAIPSRPLRDGQKSGKVTIDVGDFIITRTFTQAGGGTLTVTNKEGAKYPSPQAILDNLTGKLTFDPIQFSRMSPAEQLLALKRLVGIDMSKIDDARRSTYDERTIVNRELKQAQANAATCQSFPDAPAMPVSVAELSAELQAAQAENKKIDDAKQAADRTGYQIKVRREKIAETNVEIERLRHEINRLKGVEADLSKGLREMEAAHKTQVEAIPTERADEQSIITRIEGAEAINKKVAANQRAVELKARVVETEKVSNALTEKIAAFDAEKIAMISSAAFPVPGLSLDEHGVTYNGIPFDQASSAEQLRVSVAMGIAMNPKLKVLLIRDGSLLDEKSLKIISDMAVEADAQVWIERVSKGKECSLIIEDGEIK
jgi:DNA repair exonuclease SbcCD ATPase subunit